MSKCTGVGLRVGLKYTPNCTSHWNSLIRFAVGLETLAAPLNDCNKKRAWRYLWSAEKLGISRAETPDTTILQSFSKLSSSDKKSGKDNFVWRVARGNSCKAVLLRYFWKSSSIWHWQNSFLSSFIFVIVVVVTIIICKNEIHLLAGSL